MTGSGEIHWKSNIYWYHAEPSRLVLTGDNSFSGSLIVEQMNSYGSLQHVSLAHENAAKNMVINLWGDGNSHPGLAISTETARVAGIGGTVNTFVYAGAVKTKGNQDNPKSKSLNTLIINTAGEKHIYNGTLLGDSANGLHIVKEGAGSQTFTGSDNVAHDIQALQGSLIFTNAPTVNGDIALARGASLQVGTSLNLASGQSLTITGDSSSAGAVLNSELCFNGGSLVFVTYNVAENAAVTVSGRIHADNQSGKGVLVKDGDGKMTISHSVNLATLNLKRGETILSAANNQFGLLDGAMSGSAQGTLRLAEDASLKITGAIRGRSAGAIVLEEGASLTSTQKGVIISNRNQATEARITNTSSSGSEYSLSNKDFVLSGAHLQYDSSKNATISNKLLSTRHRNPLHRPIRLCCLGELTTST